ncbi:lipid A biosynthesis acyltransferase [Paucibacter sp. TC2R-5]|uniref:LpxL/LpxP family acyltransferase n=1 Tax=Paucibacter sp. TC2R-5 TaxID=2893555 RepID=UPI0021E3B48F|nr:lipid A biosynthesis acyltransferase [Paucibacter sp. TC2R-5]MCV2361567.1 lipid A biosynthesis acyltransferase [Paucibacter sp. TC2R-5]
MAARMGARIGAHLAIGLLWLLHFLPLGLLAALGQGLGAVLWRLAKSRRRIALRNLALCFPEKTDAQRELLAREHFGWMGRSILERGLLWFASPERLRRLIHIKGDIKVAENSSAPVMWWVPHFAGLDVVGNGLMLNQQQPGVFVYQRQSNPVFDAQMLAGRSRFGVTTSVIREEGIRPVLRLIREGHAFFNLPDMDFGRKDSAFVPFFGIPTCTLLAPGKIASSMKMLVVPLVATMLPGGQGYVLEVWAAPPGYPSGDLEADAAQMNAWLEQRIRENPAQYLWVHKRFKTRPEGEPSLYV